jgi:hypothetical protein
MRKTIIAMTAACALVFSTSAFAVGGNGGNGGGTLSPGGNGGGNGNAFGSNNQHNNNVTTTTITPTITTNIGSSKFNIGGQNNGTASVSGIGSNQNTTGIDDRVMINN